MASLVINVPGEYISLGLVMQSALEQASKGKGRERHAEEGEPYEKQVICEVARRVGLGYPLGQAVKKIYESQRLIPQLGVQELLGALNYVAAAVIVMQERMDEEGRRFREGFASSKAEGCEEPEFKPGDPVEWFCFRREDAVTGWHPAFYLCKSGDADYHIVQDIDGRYHVVHCANLRNPEAEFKPGDKVEALSFDGTRWEEAVVERTEFASGQWHCTVRLASGERHRLPVAGSIRRPARAGDKAEGCEEPEFKYGDSLLVTMPEGEDVHCVYIGESTHPGCCCVRYESGDLNGETDDTVPIDQIRREPAPKAEGCEELVHDAPQTPEETCQRIVDSNPATYGQPRTPTGEELAEMAEEVPDGH